MLLIECPYCGPRDEIEFRNGGQAHVPYPADPSALSDRDWAEYLFYRDNPRGRFAERWLHTAGCRKWFNAVRDTAIYEFAAVYPIDAPRPEAPADSRPGALHHSAEAPSGSHTGARPHSAEAPAPTSSSTPTGEGGNR
ncbi:sarcosine oxidase subunit delta [Brevibacterium daeguense]|uniref:sarcosine oxidase subunit delta n=1 Tax=Brevibacterium daeguense TaxID=909936 RepID=UPI001F3DAF0A|nr:sarcosine oxidase subunit delta [Brevibacterium daeguense]